MEINENEMKTRLQTLMKPEEKILCPVFGMIRKKVTKVTHNASEYCYMTVTSKGRFVLYRFDDHSSRPESYEFITLTFGEITVTQQGQYIGNLEFLTDSGSAEVNISYAPKIKDKYFPNQEKYAEKMYRLLKKLTGDELPE